jgi:HD-like signal output (HDOD) protein
VKSLPDWVKLLGTLKTPVLASTVQEMARLRKDEDSVTARDLANVLLRDPLMTLKTLRFSQSRLTRRQPTEVTTVEHALMMHGLTSFFRETRDLTALETQLAGQPEALDGALRVISRGVHAASFARNFSALRHDMDTDEVVTSALLHDLAELLLWCNAPSIALQIEHMVNHSRGLRSAAAQHACLGFTLVDLQLALAREWKLPSLLLTLMDDAHAQHPRALTVSLSVALARHSANGWYDAALPSDYSAIEKLVNLPPEALQRWVNQSTLQSARLWKHIGIRPAAAWLPMSAGAWPEPEVAPVREPLSHILGEVNVQLAQVTKAAGDYHAVLALLFYAFTMGLGLRRLWFGVLDQTGRKVEPKQTLLLDAGLLPGELSYEIKSTHLFARLMGKMQGVWFGAAQRDKLAVLLPEMLRKKIGGRDFFAMSVFVKGQPFGMIYADGGAMRTQLGERDYSAFKTLCVAANEALERIAA